MRKPRILVVDDEEPMLELLTIVLARYDVTTAANGLKGAVALLGPQPFDVALIDVRLPGANGHELLKVVKTASPGTEVVMMTAYAAVRDAVAVMKEGAFDYIEKPFDPDDVILVVARALECRRQRLSQAALAGAGDAAVITASMSFREAAEAGRDRASRAYLEALMREFDGRVTPAAERAGMERESLHRLLRRYRIRTRDFRRSSPDRADVPGSVAAGS